MARALFHPGTLGEKEEAWREIRPGWPWTSTSWRSSTRLVRTIPAVPSERRHVNWSRQFHATFGEEPPFKMEALASFRGIPISPKPPAHSPDSELQPDGEGGVLLHLNRNLPLTRQRFSVGHEITHTFFPGYEEKVRCRKPKARDWSDPEDVLEVLCDIGASELLFPQPWFGE